MTEEELQDRIGQLEAQLQSLASAELSGSAKRAFEDMAKAFVANVFTMSQNFLADMFQLAQNSAAMAAQQTYKKQEAADRAERLKAGQA